MKRFLNFLKKCKKAFTLMECVCAIAVVGLLSAAILPLTYSAINSINASDALRRVASDAAAQNASVTSNKNDTAHSQTMYVTIDYRKGDANPAGINGMRAESAFVFTKTSSSDSNYSVSVTYYDLKNGMEVEDIKK